LHGVPRTVAQAVILLTLSREVLMSPLNQDTYYYFYVHTMHIE